MSQGTKKRKCNGGDGGGGVTQDTRSCSRLKGRYRN